MSSLLLAGKRILVTRAAGQAGKLSQGLRELGAEPIEVPLLEIQPPTSFAALDRALRALDSYDWLILTSTNTVEALLRRATALGLALKKPEGLKIAAIGLATAEAAQAAGFSVEFLPEKSVAESLVAGLGGLVQGQSVLLVRAEVARDLIPDALRAAGARVDVAEAYRNAMPEGAADRLRAAMAGGLDAVTFTSSSSVTHLQEAAQAAGLEWPLAGVKAISIGPITSQTLHEAGWAPVDEADPHDLPGLLAAVARVLS